MMRQMGGLRPPDSKPNFDDLDNDGNDGEADSDDEEMPDLEWIKNKQKFDNKSL